MAPLCISHAIGRDVSGESHNIFKYLKFYTKKKQWQ
jgi:hypothetical protein